jgi:hypothetical protein
VPLETRSGHEKKPNFEDVRRGFEEGNALPDELYAKLIRIRDNENYIAHFASGVDGRLMKRFIEDRTRVDRGEEPVEDTLWMVPFPTEVFADLQDATEIVIALAEKKAADGYRARIPSRNRLGPRGIRARSRRSIIPLRSPALARLRLRRRRERAFRVKHFPGAPRRPTRERARNVRSRPGLYYTRTEDQIDGSFFLNTLGPAKNPTVLRWCSESNGVPQGVRGARSPRSAPPPPSPLNRSGALRQLEVLHRGESARHPSHRVRGCRARPVGVRTRHL